MGKEQKGMWHHDKGHHTLHYSFWMPISFFNIILTFVMYDSHIPIVYSQRIWK